MFVMQSLLFIIVSALAIVPTLALPSPIAAPAPGGVPKSSINGGASVNLPKVCVLCNSSSSSSYIHSLFNNFFLYQQSGNLRPRSLPEVANLLGSVSTSVRPRYKTSLNLCVNRAFPLSKAMVPRLVSPPVHCQEFLRFLLHPRF